MLLAIDIGNTNVTVGLFKNDVLIQKFYFEHHKNEHPQFYNDILVKENMDVNSCIICSVAGKITSVIIDVIQNLYNIKPLIVTSEINLGIGIKAEFPDKIGTDRITNTCAVNKLYSKPAIIVDMGTATTFDIISADGNFIGGIIFPGVETQLHSLHTDTSKLPEINIQKADEIETTINTETSKAILAGVLKGHAHAIEGLLKDCKKEIPSDSIVILTGGNVNLIAKYMDKKTFDIIDQNLTLKGLNIIYQLNNQIKRTDKTVALQFTS